MFRVDPMFDKKCSVQTTGMAADTAMTRQAQLQAQLRPWSSVTGASGRQPVQMTPQQAQIVHALQAERPRTVIMPCRVV